MEIFGESLAEGLLKKKQKFHSHVSPILILLTVDGGKSIRGGTPVDFSDSWFQES